MDALSTSRIHLMSMGIICDESPSSLLKVWNHCARVISLIMVISLISIQLYGVIYYDNILIINITYLTVYFLESLTYLQMFSRTERLFSMLRHAFRKMDKATVLKIKNFDHRHVTFKFCYACTMVIGLVVYYSISGSVQEASIICMGFKESFSPTFVKIVFFSTIWTYWLFMFLMQFYVSIMFATVQVAKYMRSEFMRWSIVGEHPDHEMMREYLEWYNKLMRSVNEEAGIVPFSLLGMEFVGFACGLSFFVTQSDLGMSPWMMAFSMGAMNCSFVKSFYQLIKLAHQSRRYISRAWKIAEESVARPVSQSLFPPHDQNLIERKIAARKSLKFFLLTEKVITAKAADSITIDRSLILKFFNQLIPFTVMMFTTLKEFDGKPGMLYYKFTRSKIY
jgi:hypothetical protein